MLRGYVITKLDHSNFFPLIPLRSFVVMRVAGRKPSYVRRGDIPARRVRTADRFVCPGENGPQCGPYGLQENQGVEQLPEARNCGTSKTTSACASGRATSGRSSSSWPGTNDRRADLKRQVNAMLGSRLGDEKQYQAYD